MGVHGLWELLAPVGRRVSVETLAGKKLAIDASIWMVQFMKAMRDEKGEMVRNAHVLGFFRRICKLLYLRTKPVFVFDGGTPALKRKTVIARRRQRENAQAKIRKTAEKLLLNHIKAMRLKELVLDLQKQKQENDIKGKKSILGEPDPGQDAEKTNGDMPSNSNREKVDEMLAASLSTEENELFSGHVSTSPLEDEDEEMILLELNGKVDPAVLATLPPSMQLDLLSQMRERLMAENRQKYQKVKKAPERFSELQIQSYLKTVAFRREIDGVQKAAAGRGVGGVQTSRIASEANREYIFSSSFTGDKRSLTSGEESSMISDQIQPHSDNGVRSTMEHNDAALPTVSETGDDLDGVETYLDERGRLRVSRMRALGIRMTRDLQRNLDLMKEIEEEKEENQEDDSSECVLNQDFADRENPRISDDVLEHIEPSGARIEISFDDTRGVDIGDELFSRLVAGDPRIDFSVDQSDSAKEPLLSPSDNEWEEPSGARIEISFDDTPGVDIGDELFSRLVAGDPRIDFSVDQSDSVKEPFLSSSDNEWEEGSIETKKVTLQCDDGLSDEGETERRTVTKGALQEEADLQEAIRRSLDDASCSKSTFDFHEYHVSEGARSKSSASGFSESFLGISSLGDSAASKEFTSKQSLPKNMHLQDADGSEAMTEEKFVNALPEEFSPSAEVTNHPVYEQMGTVIEANAGASSGSVLRSATSDEIFCDTMEPSAGLDDAECTVGEKLITMASTTMKPSHSKDNEDEEIIKGRLEEEILHLDKESDELGIEQRKLERNAESVSGEMFAECQELLQMFGLPYIIAPMEAEAQCAFMELSNLVDGVVTDDSDALLFGSRSVYKNIFDDRKYVETYFMKDIETELGLDREKLINMALLLGSDYTEGISGIGIVNAIEVVNAFPDKEGLREFRQWIESPDPSILGNPKKKGSKGSETVKGTSDEQCSERKKQMFMENHRNVSKNWHVPSSFPSEAVIYAYASPQVDRSTDPFSWGKPDLFALRRLCSEKFGWGNSKADELLVPVLKEYNKHETQMRLEAFYTFNERFAKIRSKRIRKAVKGMVAGNSSCLSSDSTDPPPAAVSGGRGKKKRKAKAAPAALDDSGGNEIRYDGGGGDDGVGDGKTENVVGGSEKTARSDDHLEFGGGFCLEEEALNPASSSGDLTVQGSPGIVTVDHIPVEEATTNPFRAMPNLRKKNKC